MNWRDKLQKVIKQKPRPLLNFYHGLGSVETKLIHRCELSPSHFSNVIDCNDSMMACIVKALGDYSPAIYFKTVSVVSRINFNGSEDPVVYDCLVVMRGFSKFSWGEVNDKVEIYDYVYPERIYPVLDSDTPYDLVWNYKYLDTLLAIAGIALRANVSFSDFTNSRFKSTRSTLEGQLTKASNSKNRYHSKMLELESENRRLEKELNQLGKELDKYKSRKRKPHNPKGYVYVLKEHSGEYYKIGKTSNPKDRKRTFSVKLPFRVEYEILLKTNDRHKLEDDLHKKFAHKRVDGEWFALSNTDLAYIRQLSARTDF